VFALLNPNNHHIVKPVGNRSRSSAELVVSFFI